MTSLPLLLLPGLLLDGRLFRAQVPALAARGPVQVADLSRDDSIEGMAARVLKDAPSRFALCGLSMGGYVALEIMRQAPERVDRLALLDTQAGPENEEARSRRLKLIKLAEQGEFLAVPSQLMPLFVHPDRLKDKHLTGEIRAMAQATGEQAFVRQQQAIMGRKDSVPSLGAIACPTLVLTGRQDALAPPALHEEMAAAIPRATLVVLPDCGHLSPMEQPDAVTRQLDIWLGPA